MTPEKFAYWLQGFVEMNNKSHHPTPRQWEMIKKKLRASFKDQSQESQESILENK